MFCSYLLFLLLFVSLKGFYCTADENRLELVSIVFRHGDRSPVIAYPNDPYQEEAWPQGFGQLTEVGMREEYHLGQILKKRYIDTGYMYSNYTRNQIYVRSTDFDRTLMSGECVLAGLYPTNDSFISNLNWQPIPIHTTPSTDEILLGQAECPVYAKLLQNDQHIYDKINTDNKDLFASLSKDTGEVVNTSTVGLLRDTLFVEYTHNLTMPSWFNVSILDKLTSLDTIYFQLQANTDEKKKLVGGVWTNKVLGDMESKINNTLKDMKMFVYSAHDTTVSAMMGVFDLFNEVQPPYSAAFIIELYYNNSGNNYYVKFLYHNDTWSDTLVELIHPNCTINCSVETLQKLMKPYRLTQDEWMTACQLSPSPTTSPTPSLTPSSTPSHSFPLWIGLTIGLGTLSFILVALLLFTLLLIVCCKCCKIKKQASYILVDSEGESDY